MIFCLVISAKCMLCMYSDRGVVGCIYCNHVEIMKNDYVLTYLLNEFLLGSSKSVIDFYAAA